MKYRHLLLISILTAAPLVLAIAPNDPAPNFSAKNQDGKTIQLSDFKGKFVLIYFYPKDDTPGCTREACQFRDSFSRFKDLNAVVLGVSRQGAKSHQEFRTKYKLPFDLLIDTDGSLTQTYDVGKIPILGFSKRDSVLIGPDGKIVQIYRGVDPDQHAKQVIEDIKKARLAATP